MRSLISLRHVPTYDPQSVLHAMRECLAPWGGMGAFVRPGQRVRVKPNLLIGFSPERAVTTHPAVVRAAVLLAQEGGGTVVVEDSPGVGRLASVVRSAGLIPGTLKSQWHFRLQRREWLASRLWPLRRRPEDQRQ